MKTLKNKKLLQIILGFGFAIILLSGFYILGETVNFPENAFWNIAEPVILGLYMLVFMATLSLLALFSKHFDLNALFYSTFGVCITSVLSAILHWHIEDSFLLLVMPITNLIGTPIRSFSTALEYATTYTETIVEPGYGTYSYDQTLLYENYVLTFLLVVTLVSVVVFQLYANTEKHLANKSKWRMEAPARVIALVTIITNGTIMVLRYASEIFYDIIIFEIIYGILAALSLALWFTAIIIVAPVSIIIYLLFSATKQARKTKNSRQIFNPLTLLSIIFTIMGTYTIYDIVMNSF